MWELWPRHTSQLTNNTRWIQPPSIHYGRLLGLETTENGRRRRTSPLGYPCFRFNTVGASDEHGGFASGRTTRLSKWFKDGGSVHGLTSVVYRPEGAQPTLCLLVFLLTRSSHVCCSLYVVRNIHVSRMILPFWGWLRPQPASISRAGNWAAKRRSRTIRCRTIWCDFFINQKIFFWD